MVTVDRSSQRGIVVGIDPVDRTSVFLDQFDPSEMNGHMVVMETPGAGSSLFGRLRALREAQRGVPVYVVDRHGGYSGVAEAVGGRVLSLGVSGDGLNPFSLRHTGEFALSYRIFSLSFMLRVMLQDDMSPDLGSSIDRCLTDFYASELRLLGDGAVLGRDGMAAFHAFLRLAETRESGGARLAPLLSVCLADSSVGGGFHRLFENGVPGLLETGVPLTSFNLSGLPARLVPVATAICLEAVWELAVSAPGFRLLLVDDCAPALSTRWGADGLLNVVKRARKTGLGVAVVVREPVDFLEGSGGAEG